MKIKFKLTLGLLFLFVVIILITTVSILYINRLANDSKAILKANYESLEFSGDMLEALDLYVASDTSWHAKFKNALERQEKNITETGELELTTTLRAQFQQLINDTSVTRINSMRFFIYRIIDLNMNAIVGKNSAALKTAENAKMYIAIISSICLLISLSFIINFPGYIANPIRELTAGIREVANKNYSQRLHLKSEDEFGELAQAFNTMASRLDQYENSNLAKIIFEKKRIETIINNMQDAIIGFNEKNVILFANEQALKLLAMPEEELLGKYAPDVAVRNDLLRTLINPEQSIKPIKIYAEGKESYFTKELYPITANDTPIGQVIILKNITSFRELDIAKTNFIATISHELKTPISSIKMSLKLLEDKRVGTVNSEQEKLIINIKEDAQRLLKITGELLDLAQVETGNIQLQKQRVLPKQIIDYACHALKIQAEQKNISLNIVCDDHLPGVTCDLEKTAWVMVNFLSNAIRYSQENSQITVQSLVKNSELIFSVKDAGPGIEHRFLDKIFERFFKVPGADHSKSGTGLGLAISKEFILAQGGKIWATSEIGNGSTFYFSFPA